MEAPLENPPTLSIEALSAMSAKEIVDWCMKSKSGLNFRELAIAMTQHLPGDDPNRSEGIRTRQIWNMTRGFFYGHADAPHHIAFIRYFFPDDQAAEKIFLKKIAEWEMSMKEGGSTKTSSAETLKTKVPLSPAKDS